MDFAYISRHFFQFTDIMSMVGWAIIIGLLLFLFSMSFSRKDRLLFRGLFFFKLVFVFVFIVFYAFISKGGDTLTYWHDSEPLFNAFTKNPFRYLQILWEGDPQVVNNSLLDTDTGYFAGRTYARVSSFVTIKVTSIFYILTIGSYLAGSMIVVFLSTLLHWKLFTFFREKLRLNQRRFVFLFLFIPSFPFWCAGVSKDTWMALIVLALVWLFFRVIYERRNYVFFFLLGLILIYLGVRIRSIIIYITLLVFAMSYAIYLLNKIDINYLRNGLKTLLYVGAIGAVFAFIAIDAADKALESNETFSEAIVKQKDFTENKLYGDKKYSLGFETYTTMELIVKSPLVVVSGIYRPFIWEALSVSLILNGIESVILIFYSFKFIMKRIRKKWFSGFEQITGNFSLIFTLLLGFVAGFISILYGVLVRFRAPLLPFFGLLLSLEQEDEKEN